MTAHKIYWKVRETLVTLGFVPRKRSLMQRQPVGECRSRLTGRGSRRRFRRIPLSRLLAL
jgi:hypothetical protein